MDVYDIERLIEQRMLELDREVRRLRGQLSLQDVLDQVYFEPKCFLAKPLEPGQELEFPLRRGNCKVKVSPIRLELIGPNSISIGIWYSTLSDDNIGRFYDEKYQAIIDAQYPGDLPF